MQILSQRLQRGALRRFEHRWRVMFGHALYLDAELFVAALVTNVTRLRQGRDIDLHSWRSMLFIIFGQDKSRHEDKRLSKIDALSKGDLLRWRDSLRNLLASEDMPSSVVQTTISLLEYL